MSTLLHIRKEVLGISQAEMAEIASTTQATISRWERGELHPDLPQMTRIRCEALRRGLAWDDSFFFSHPNVTTRQEAS